MTEFKTIKTFEYPHEAQITKNKLESEGVYVFLKDEYTVQTDNFLSNAIGGVKLQVLEKDVEKSKEILKIFKQKFQENLLEIEIQKNNKIYCPNCNSTNVRKSDKPSNIVGLSYFLFLIPLPNL